MRALRRGTDAAAALLSPLLLFFAFPNPVFERGLPFLTTIGLFPLFFLLLNAEKVRYLWVSAAGVLTYLFVHFWLYTFNPLAMIFVCGVMGVAYLLFTVYVTAVRRCFGESAYLPAAAGFTVFEFLKTVGFLAFPYGISGYTQYSVPGMRDMASVFGVFAVSFCLTFPAAFFAAAAGMPGRVEAAAFVYRQRRRLMAFAVLFAFMVIVGTVQTASVKPLDREAADALPSSVRVLAVQHSGDTWTGGFPTYRRNYEILKNLTDRALSENNEAGDMPYDFVIWPETAFVPGIEWHSRYNTSYESKDLVDRFLEWAETVPGTLITGNSESCLADPSQPPVIYDAEGKGRLNRDSYNAAVVLEGGQIIGTYRKRHLVPVVEYFPWEETFPDIVRFLEAHGCQLWAPGEEAMLFHTRSGVPFSVSICYEDVFAEIARRDARNGSRLMINLTNDSWSGTNAAQMQHLAIAVFRSLETGLPSVRATNSGITAVILPNGKISTETPPFIKTVMSAEVPLYEPAPFANAFFLREAFPLLLMIVLAAAFAVRIFRMTGESRKNKESGKLVKKR